jgi:hypothetical protein
MNKHKWHKEIVAWASGAEIEFRYIDRLHHSDGWSTSSTDPTWNDEVWEFRIKPQPKQPKYLYAYRSNKGIELGLSFIPEYRFTSDMSFIGKIEVLNDD